MVEMLKIKKNLGGHRHVPQWGGGHPYFGAFSSPSLDAEPSHFSFLSDAYCWSEMLRWRLNRLCILQLLGYFSVLCVLIK